MVSSSDHHLAIALAAVEGGGPVSSVVRTAVRDSGAPSAEVSDRRLLVVDDDEAVRQIVAELLRDEGYEPSTAATADEAVAMMRQSHFPLVITDIKMPGRDGITMLREIRSEFPDAAVIMMTGYGQVESAVEALKWGASDYLTKPIRVNHLAAAVLRALDRRRLVLEHKAYQRDLEGAVLEKTAALEHAYQQISETYRITLESLVTALDARECETGSHSQRVVRFSLAIGDRMGVTGQGRDDLARGALLHDIGKIGVPDHILLKPARLTEDEWIEMRKHPEIGARIISGIEFLAPAADIVLAHQERWDGQGYPRRLRGDQIPLGARIFAVADTIDAITTDRPYRRGRSFGHAREELLRCSGTQFDPAVVAVTAAITDLEWMRLRGEEPPFKARPASGSFAPR
ncbi:MAG: response regulator [Deltaproteobacteria bacterium]|nr:response regulator [Deltaproteobacteria bacterium]